MPVTERMTADEFLAIEDEHPRMWLVDGDAGVVLVFRRSAPNAPTFDVALEFDRTAALTSPQLTGFALDVGALFAS